MTPTPLEAAQPVREACTKTGVGCNGADTPTASMYILVRVSDGNAWSIVELRSDGDAKAIAWTRSLAVAEAVAEELNEAFGG